VFLDEIPHWFIIVVAVSLGLNFGSFLNVVIYRLPRGLSLSRPGSQCPDCETPIKIYDNIPVFGWLLLRGKSRCCKKRISFRYPLVETMGGLIAWTIVVARILPNEHDLLVSDAALLFGSYLLLSLGLLAAAAIDMEHMILPDSITWGGTVLGLATSFLRPEVEPLYSLLGAVIGYVGIWFPFIWLHEKLRGFPGMGLGDAKLMALAGAWFGPLGVLLVLFGGAIQGTCVAVTALLVHGKIEEPPAVAEQREELLAAIDAAEGAEREELEQMLADDPLGMDPEEAPGGARIAFGPFLALAVIELLLFFEPVMSWIQGTFYL